jgi:hypothetical protein
MKMNRNEISNIQSLSEGLNVYIILGIVIIVILISMKMWNVKHRENYGGPVKRIHRIPLNTCYDICKQHYDVCMAQYQYIDAGNCSTRYEACKNICRYSDYHAT